MTRTIPHRDLRNNSSAVLRDVEGGEVIEVTNNGHVVAVLVPPHRPAATVHYTTATYHGKFADLPLVRIDGMLQGVLDDLKGDR